MCAILLTGAIQLNFRNHTKSVRLYHSQMNTFTEQILNTKCLRAWKPNHLLPLINSVADKFWKIPFSPTLVFTYDNPVQQLNFISKLQHPCYEYASNRPVHAIENQRVPWESFHCSFSSIFRILSLTMQQSTEFVHCLMSIHLLFPFLFDCVSAHAGIPRHL